MLGAIQLNDLSVAAQMGLPPALLPTSYSPDVTLAPATSTRNLVQPVVDVTALRLQRNGSGSTSPILSIEDQAANPLVRFTASGGQQLGTPFGIGATTDTVQIFGITNNAGNATTAGKELVSRVNASNYAFTTLDFSINNPSAPTQSLNIFNFAVQGTYNNAGTLSSSNFFCYDNTRGNYVFLGEAGGDSRFAVGNRFFNGQLAVSSHITLSQQPVLSLQYTNAPTNTNGFIEAFDNNGNDRFWVRTNGNLEWWGLDSTSNTQIAQITPTYAANTHASYQGRLELAADSFGGLFPAIRIEATGTAAAIGFLGTAAAVRPTTAYTLTGTAGRVFPTDPSSAFTGIASGVGGTPYAQLTDLNTLRTAVSTLIGICRQMATDLGSTSGYGLLNA